MELSNDLEALRKASGGSFETVVDVQTNAMYIGSLDRSDLAAFAARVKNPTNWTANYTAAPGFPLTDGSFYPGN